MIQMVKIKPGILPLYGFIKKSWNPIVGCTHECDYCWARKKFYKLNSGKVYLKRNFNEPELVYRNNDNEDKYIKKVDNLRGPWVFVCNMGDLFCFNRVIKKENIKWVLNTLNLKKRSDLQYLFVTKDPERYMDFISEFPKNSYLGTTIETDNYDIIKKYHSKAPDPFLDIRQ